MKRGVVIVVFSFGGLMGEGEEPNGEGPSHASMLAIASSIPPALSPSLPLKKSSLN
jgi:hypothetical protein